MKNQLGMIIAWGWRVFRMRGPAVIGGMVVAVLCFVLLNMAMEPVSTDSYCGTACHEMNPAYLSWELSIHGANEDGITVHCIECHLPPKEDFFTHVIAKARAGARDLYHHYCGPPYDLAAMRKLAAEHMPNKTCAHCHNNLLAKPRSAKARFSHMAAINKPDTPENKCMECHLQAGHERTAKIFSPPVP